MLLVYGGGGGSSISSGLVAPPLLSSQQVLLLHPQELPYRWVDHDRKAMRRPPRRCNTRGCPVPPMALACARDQRLPEPGTWMGDLLRCAMA